MKIKELMRTGHVKRWHIVRVGREQTIAEHMYRVWLICEEIGARSHMEWHRRIQMERIALVHDIPEVVMGDIPTPTKLVIGDNTECLDKLEEGIDKVNQWFIQEMRESDPILVDVVKLADMIEAIHFLKEEGIGDHARSVRSLITDQYHDKLKNTRQKYPEHATLLDSVVDVYTDLTIS